MITNFAETSWPAKNPRLQGGKSTESNPSDEGIDCISKSWSRVKCGLVEDSSSLSSSFSHLFSIKQSQAGGDDFRHGIHDRTQNLVGDDFVGLCRQAAF